jgi:hypothetical protein
VVDLLWQHNQALAGPPCSGSSECRGRQFWELLHEWHPVLKDPWRVAPIAAARTHLSYIFQMLLASCMSTERAQADS